MSDDELMSVIDHFAIKGKVTEIKPIGNGHINNTYKVITTERIYVLQKINNSVFRDIAGLMNNLVRVTNHLIENGVFTLRFKPTFEGKLYYETPDGFYRLYKYIPHAYCYEQVDDLEVVEKAGAAFGNFHSHLSDIDVNQIVDVIPDFHDTKKRYDKFLKAISLDSHSRAKKVNDEIKFLVSNNKYYSIIVDALNNKDIPTTITHNDPKINNILFDKETLDVKAIIDLDTVMTGSVIYDFGDAVRSLFTGQNEDNKDVSSLKANLGIYESYLKGYYSQMKNVLCQKEIELLPYSVLILTLELALRFLTDYIEGDIYFRIKKEGHNLDRARTQIALAKDIISNFDSMVEITKRVCK